MKDLVLEGIKALQNVSPNDLEAYGDLLLPTIGAGISGFFVYMQKLAKSDRPRFVLFLVILSSFAAGSLLYVKDIIDGNPLIAGTIASLSAIVFHNFLYKPLVKRLVPFIRQKFANARLYQATSTAAVEDEIPGRITSSEF